MKECLATISKLQANIRKVIVGKDNRIRLALAAWFAGGHLLLEDVPGTGKTMLARAIARSVNVDFKRVQFTPDLLPSDVLGATVYRTEKNTFELYPGPIFTSIFLGDEINRATPRTQSALLEAMAERQVSIDGTTYELNSTFFVVATQNPLEQQGTFPLPEAQLDRFLIKMDVGYPKNGEEIQMLKQHNSVHPIDTLGSVCAEEDVARVRKAVPMIKVIDEIYHYAMKVVQSTRSHEDLRVGASPRASKALVRAAQAFAMMDGETFVSPTHIYAAVQPVLAHRLILTPEARLQRKTSHAILEEIVSRIPVPTQRAA